MERTPEGRSDVVWMCYAGHGGMSRTHVRSLFGEKSENWISLSPLNKTGYLLFGSVLSEITYADLSAFRRGCIKALHPPLARGRASGPTAVAIRRIFETGDGR